MAKQDNNSYQKGWKSADCNMTTSPSVGRFSNDQTATLYVKGSSAKFDDNDGRKTMAPYSNYGNLSQQASQQPASDIVDLRTASGTEYKPHIRLVPEEWGCSHQSMAISETSDVGSFEPEVKILNNILNFVKDL